MKIFDFTKSNHKQSGFTLIELLVAVTISLFILAGVGVVMVSSRSSYEVQDFNARLQENARFAMQFLSHDLRMAGYKGCAPAPLAGIPALVVSPNSYTSIKGATVAIGDDLTIRFTDPNNVLLADAIGAIQGATSIALTLGQGSLSQFKDGVTIVIADCGGAESVDISGAPIVSGQTITLNLATPLTRNYTDKFEVRGFQTHTYSVALNPPQDDVPTLKLDRNDGLGPQDLVEGVELIRFLFGLDTDGDGVPNSYINHGGGSPDLSNAVSVQVGVLVRSVSNYRSPDVDNNPTREFGNSESPLNDGAYPILDLADTTVEGAMDDLRVNRHVFTTTLKVRN